MILLYHSIQRCVFISLLTSLTIHHFVGSQGPTPRHPTKEAGLLYLESQVGSTSLTKPNKNQGKTTFSKVYKSEK